MKIPNRNHAIKAMLCNKACLKPFLLTLIVAPVLFTSVQARPKFNPTAGRQRMAQPAYVNSHQMNITLATIRVPVKLHRFLPNELYSVQCEVYDRPHGSLRKRGDGASDYVAPPASGEVNTVVSVAVHPLKRVSATSPLVTWQCHLNIAGKGVGSRLSSKADSHAPFRGNVGGQF